ncbi:unnamed protein product [Oncorhynchus mykiss]|uniref:CHCH domain-containing protein n=1 Tax=Oncorhynchus mykiss TaxID=8022 RepID=A0A060YLZ6_ONCMY|nr:unnamed protein product [Oncorhynchus mykiss]
MVCRLCVSGIEPKTLSLLAPHALPTEPHGTSTPCPCVFPCRPRPAVSICPELQAQVLHCYKENQQQTLHCSTVAKEYMDCIQAAKKTLLINHG